MKRDFVLDDLGLAYLEFIECMRKAEEASRKIGLYQQKGDWLRIANLIAGVRDKAGQVFIAKRKLQ